VSMPREPAGHDDLRIARMPVNDEMKIGRVGVQTHLERHYRSVRAWQVLFDIRSQIVLILAIWNTIDIVRIYGGPAVMAADLDAGAAVARDGVVGGAFSIVARRARSRIPIQVVHENRHATHLEI